MDPYSNTTLIGTSIGNYQVVSQLGSGAMGEVFLGEHPQIGRRVAIKVLVESLANSPAMTERFMSEARAVNKINHPNIIQIFDFGQLPDGRLYYTMEYLQGQELKVILKERAPLSLQSSADVLRQIAGALQAAHREGIVHRDLKPENIFVIESEGGFTIKILDFGIAKLLEPDMGGRHKTSTGMIMGTPLYMSPEQAAGNVAQISPLSDIYALGVIAYQMLSGRLPIDAPTTAQILAMHITEPPTPLSQVAQGIPPTVAAVVEGSLSKDPALRPRTAQEFYASFAHACAGSHPDLVAIPLTLPGQSMVGSSSQAGISSAGETPTTLRNSASEIMAINEEEPGGGGGKVAAVVILLLLALGGVAFGAWYLLGRDQGGGDKDSAAKVASGMEAMKAMEPMQPTEPMPPPRVMRPAEARKPPMEAALKVYKVSVKSKTDRVRIEITIGAGRSFKKRPPFKLDVKGGERVTLRASRKGYEDAVETFLATGDKSFDFQLERVARSGMRRARPMRPRVRPRRTRPRSMRGVGEGTLKPMF